MSALDVGFVALLALAAYPYVGYPLLLYLFTRREDPPSPGPGPLPTVTVIVSAYEEEDVIGDRIRNLAELNYPQHRIEVLIGSDGSADRTARRARRAARETDLRVVVVDFPERRGKTAVLRDLIDRAAGEIVVLSDANTSFEPEAARRLVRWFRDPEVGCVCGRLALVPDASGGWTEHLYWRWETELKRLENRLGAVLGANGAVYAFRKDVYEPPEEDVITDDFVIPMLIRARGYRIVFDETAVAREETAPSIRDEFTRRARIGAGNLQALRLTYGLLTPSAGWTAFAYLSHKVIRWLAPLLAVPLLLVAVLQIHEPFYRWIVGAAAVLLVAALGGWWMERRGRSLPAWLAVPYQFLVMNAGLLVGGINYLRGRRRGTWERTPRESGSPGARRGAPA